MCPRFTSFCNYRYRKVSRETASRPIISEGTTATVPVLGECQFALHVHVVEAKFHIASNDMDSYARASIVVDDDSSQRLWHKKIATSVLSYNNTQSFLTTFDVLRSQQQGQKQQTSKQHTTNKGVDSVR